MLPKLYVQGTPFFPECTIQLLSSNSHFTGRSYLLPFAQTYTGGMFLLCTGMESASSIWVQSTVHQTAVLKLMHLAHGGVPHGLLASGSNTSGQVTGSQSPLWPKNLYQFCLAVWCGALPFPGEILSLNVTALLLYKQSTKVHPKTAWSCTCWEVFGSLQPILTSLLGQPTCQGYWIRPQTCGWEISYTHSSSSTQTHPAFQHWTPDLCYNLSPPVNWDRTSTMFIKLFKQTVDMFCTCQIVFCIWCHMVIEYVSDLNIYVLCAMLPLSAHRSGKEHAEHYPPWWLHLQIYLNEGLSVATRRTYSTKKRSFTSFYISTGNRVLPATESALLLFVSHLASKNISHTTIKVYLVAVCHMHVIASLHRLFEEQLTPRLQLVLKGIKRTQAISNPCRTRLPITLKIMSGIKDCLPKWPHSQSNIMFWAACCIAFFGFLRVSEFKVPNQATYDPDTHLSLADISLDNRSTQTLLQYILSNPTFRKGVTLYLRATNHPVCLALRGSQPGPLFLTKDGQGLTRHDLTTFLDAVLAEVRLHSRSYNTQFPHQCSGNSSWSRHPWPMYIDPGSLAE